MGWARARAGPGPCKVYVCRYMYVGICMYMTKIYQGVDTVVTGMGDTYTLGNGKIIQLWDGKIIQLWDGKIIQLWDGEIIQKHDLGHK